MRPDVMMIGLRSVGANLGGVERHVKSLAEEYDRRGLRTIILVRSRFSDPSDIDVGPLTSVKSIWAPRHVALEAPVHSLIAVLYAAIRRPRILHIHAIGPSLVVPLARALGLTVVTTHHGEDYNREKWGRLARTALRTGEFFQAYFANQRICVAKGLAEKLSERFDRKFRFIPNAAGKIETPDSYDALARFGLEPGRYIVNIGRLVPEKRQIDLISAFQRLAQPDLKLALVGAGDHNSSYAKALAERANNTPGVVMTGFLQGNDLRQLIGGAAVFALPSTHEGMPIAALEAMQMGRPLVISDIQPNLELGLPKECYHSTGSPENLAERLQETLTQHWAKLPPYRDWSVELRPYDWSTIAEATIATYRAASSRFPPSAWLSKRPSITSQ